MKAANAARAVPHFEGRRIDLSWENPPASDFAGSPALAGIRIVRRQRAFARSQDDGDVIYHGPLISAYLDRELTPLTTYYYSIYTFDNAVPSDFFFEASSQTSAFATEDYKLSERLYRLLPAVHQRADVPLDAAALARLDGTVRGRLNALPARFRNRGQLYRFFHTIAPFDLMRSFAEGLRQLHDVDRVRAEYLPLLAQWIGWNLDETLPVYARRTDVKIAPRLFRNVGTPPNLRSIVTRYSEWYTQMAEFEQHLVRSNLPPQLNVFSIVQDGGVWRGIADAAPILGFGVGNEQATGLSGLPAILVSTISEPFALRPNMECAITADERIPVAVRFRPGDFANIAAATAAEVSAVFNRALSEITATPIAGGRIELRSHTVGPDSHIKVELYAASLITLDGAPRGRLALMADNTTGMPSRSRLFFVVADPLKPVAVDAAVRALRGESLPLSALPGRMPPALLSAAPILGFGAGNHEAVGGEKTSAVLTGNAREPFALRPEMELVVTVGQTDPVVVRFQAAAFNTFAAATAREVADLLNQKLFGLIVIALDDGRIELRSTTVGYDSHVRVEQYIAGLTTWSNVTPPVVQSRPNARLYYKTCYGGVWGDSLPMTRDAAIAEGEPAVAQLPDGRIFLAWIEDPGTGHSRIRWRTGRARMPKPARLFGQRSEPFDLSQGGRLLLTGTWEGIEGGQVSPLEFLVPGQATALEIATALNTRLLRVNVLVEPNGTIRLETAGSGGDEELEIDLNESSLARILGFDAGNSHARGDRGDEVDWQPVQDVAAAVPGWHSDLFAVADKVGGVAGVRLFWALFVGAEWRILSSRWDGTGWTSPPDQVGTGNGGNREPCAVVDAGGRIWFVWSQRQGVGTAEDIWTLRMRMFDPATGIWGADAAVTTAAVPRSADREPGVRLMASGDLQVFFRSDRAGGPNLWSVTINTVTGVPTGPVPVTSGSFGDHWPAPFTGPGVPAQLFYRSDRSLSLSRVGIRPIPVAENRATHLQEKSAASRPGPSRSSTAIDSGTLRRYAGSQSVILGHAARNGRRRQWDDVLSYTPQKPIGEPWEAPLQDDEFYTRGTVGLYLSQFVPSSPLSSQRIERLRSVLQRFLPINVRAVVVLAPRVDIEFLYPPGADIGESFLDEHPDIEYYSGLADEAQAVLPDWMALVSNRIDHLSANPADLLTLRRRTFYPPPT